MEREKESAEKGRERRGCYEWAVLEESQYVYEHTLEMHLLCIWVWVVYTHVCCVQIPA